MSDFMSNDATSAIDFKGFPKMARLSRECIITEKIDGTNAQVFIELASEAQMAGYLEGRFLACAGDLVLSAGSRTRYITPKQDNHGFAKWCVDNAEELAFLGPGRHFGEWWGAGINRGYGLKEKRFSLFNTIRWVLHGVQPAKISSLDPRASAVKYQEVLPPCVGLVPVLYRGPFDAAGVAQRAVRHLAIYGSRAASGFRDPEGIVVWHVAGNVGFKKTIKDDESPKSLT